MSCLLEFSLFPLGKGESVSSYVARCVTVIERSGLDYELHAMGTIVEGGLSEVLQVLADCMQELARDCDRVSCSAKLDLRAGQTGRLKTKVDKVARMVGHDVKHQASGS